MTRRGGKRGSISLSMLGERAQRQVAAILFAEQEQGRQLTEQAKLQRKHKYGARRVVVDGITFASKLEGDRYSELKRRQRLGLVSDLELQPRYPLVVKGVLVATYVADFRYRDSAGKTVAEDTKGVKLPLYKLKKKLAELLYEGLQIIEVTSCRM